MVILKCTYVSLFLQVEKKKNSQICTPGAKFKKTVQFNLHLTDAIASKTMGESTSSDKHCFQLYAFKLLASTLRTDRSGSSVFVFHFCF